MLLLAAALVGGTVYVLRGAVLAPQGPGAADPESPHVDVATRVEGALEEAGRAMGNGDYGVAETISRQAIQKAPEDQALHLMHARSLVAQQRFAEAYGSFESALAIGPAAGPLQFEAGTVASRSGQPERAIEHYSMAQADDPVEPRYPLYLGMVQLKSGDRSAAVASLIRSTHLDPELAEAWGTLAEIAYLENSLGVAAKHLGKARRLQPSSTKWKLLDAKILKRQNNPRQAALLLATLAEEDRREPPVLELLSQCHAMLGDPASAAEAYAEAFNATPDDPELAYHAAIWWKRAGDPARSQRFAEASAGLGHAEAIALLADIADGG